MAQAFSIEIPSHLPQTDVFTLIIHIPRGERYCKNDCHCFEEAWENKFEIHSFTSLPKFLEFTSIELFYLPKQVINANFILYTSLNPLEYCIETGTVYPRFNRSFPVYFPIAYPKQRHLLSSKEEDRFYEQQHDYAEFINGAVLDAFMSLKQKALKQELSWNGEV